MEDLKTAWSPSLVSSTPPKMIILSLDMLGKNEDRA